jgi:hypothetical protein
MGAQAQVTNQRLMESRRTGKSSTQVDISGAPPRWTHCLGAKGNFQTELVLPSSPMLLKRKHKR